MTDTPGWASPGSPEPPHEAAGSSAPPATGAPQDAPPPLTPPPAGSVRQTNWGPQPAWGPQTGWGQQPGWGGHPGWAVPASPKPGVIPLRPLGLGEILDGAVSSVRAHWRAALGLSFGVAVVVQTLNALVQLWQFENPDDTLAQIAYIVTVPLDVLIGVFVAGLLTVVVSKAVLGQPITLAGAWTTARPLLPRLLGVTGLVLLITLGTMLLGGLPLILTLLNGDRDPATIALLALPALAAVPVAVWLAVRLSFAAPALMLEKQGVRASLTRSRRLVKGSWWRIFGITLLGQLLLGIVSMIILAPFTMVGMAIALSQTDNWDGTTTTLGPAVILLSAVGGIISSTVTTPVTAALNVLLYVDQRIRREALDLELARAAGQYQPGDGATIPHPAPPGA